jgi:hypothetical protein
MDVRRRVKNATPFIILSVLAVLASIYFIITEVEGPEVMGFTLILLLITIGITLALDFILKKMLKVKVYVIWIIEVTMLLVLTYWWIVS